MPVTESSLSAVTEANLQALINGGVREDRTLEFKRDAYGANDEARSEFLADVSALANTLGGDLVIGLDEQQGVASSLPGLRAGVDVDQEILRLTQMAQTGLQPRLPSLEAHAVPLAAGGHALILRIGRSYQGPHRVIFKGRNRFWARSTAGRYEPDVDELRVLFGAAPQLAARLREMRADRVARVLAGETPVLLLDDPGLSILHIVPLAVAQPIPRGVDLDRMRSHSEAWFPWGADGYNESKNFDGFATFSGAHDQPTRAYIQTFRSGMIEVVAAGAVQERGADRTVSVQHLAMRLVNQVSDIMPALRDADVDPPYSVQLTLRGIRNARFMVESDQSWLRGLTPPLPVPSNVLHFVDALVGEGDLTRDQIASALRPTLVQLFQTAGHTTCPWFNRDGSLKARPH